MENPFCFSSFRWFPGLAQIHLFPIFWDFPISPLKALMNFSTQGPERDPKLGPGPKTEVIMHHLIGLSALSKLSNDLCCNYPNVILYALVRFDVKLTHSMLYAEYPARVCKIPPPHPPQFCEFKKNPSRGPLPRYLILVLGTDPDSSLYKPAGFQIPESPISICLPPRMTLTRDHYDPFR